MTQQIYFTGNIDGQDYDKRLQLYIDTTNSKKIKIFDYWLDSLFGTNDAENELQLNLNFGELELLPHAVKSIGNMVVLLPVFLSIELADGITHLAGLDWRNYVEKIAPQLFLFPKQSWDDLWNMLGVSLYGLPEIAAATSDDVFLLWLISSNFQPTFSLAWFTPEYAQTLASSILAQEPSFSPSVQEAIQKILKKEVRFDVASCEKIINGMYITVYFADKDSSAKEWNALYVKNDGQIGIVLNNWYVKLI